jgi:hypothetical protein
MMGSFAMGSSSSSYASIALRDGKFVGFFDLLMESEAILWTIYRVFGTIS